MRRRYFDRSRGAVLVKATIGAVQGGLSLSAMLTVAVVFPPRLNPVPGCKVNVSVSVPSKIASSAGEIVIFIAGVEGVSVTDPVNAGLAA